MPNLTRDPYHPRTGSYIKNMNEMTVTVGGVQLDSKRILNIYQTSQTDKPPRVEMMLENAKGEIEFIWDANAMRDKPVVYDVNINDDIVVIGDASYCGCFKKRRIKKWWVRITNNAGSW